MLRRSLLKAASAAAISGIPAIRGAQTKTPKILYFTRSAGFEHSVVKRTGQELSHSEKVLTAMGRKAGFEVECTKDGRVFDGDLGRYDAIAFYTSGDLCAPGGDGSPPMTAGGKQRLLEAVAAGKSFIGFHAATDSFHSKGPRDEPQTEVDPYVAMIGGEFIVHAEQQEASLFLVSRFPGAGSLGLGEGIAFHEEWYTHKNFAPDLHVIFVQETQYMKGACYQRPDFPATWAHMHGQGRVFYTSLGHREDIWTNPFFQAIALGGIAWTLGRADYDIKPNIADVTPLANQLKPLAAKPDAQRT